MNKNLIGRELADAGYKALCDKLFEAVRDFYLRRHLEGMTVEDIAARIERSVVWVEQYLSSSEDWTIEVAGELIQGLNGEAQVFMIRREASAVSSTTETQLSTKEDMNLAFPRVSSVLIDD